MPCMPARCLTSAPTWPVVSARCWLRRFGGIGERGASSRPPVPRVPSSTLVLNRRKIRIASHGTSSSLPQTRRRQNCTRLVLHAADVVVASLLMSGGPDRTECGLGIPIDFDAVKRPTEQATLLQRIVVVLAHLLAPRQVESHGHGTSSSWLHRLGKPSMRLLCSSANAFCSALFLIPKSPQLGRNADPARGSLRHGCS
ncbi:hypothetical protein IWX46DRAFT_586072 [Phyllosticta citricarpa]